MRCATTHLPGNPACVRCCADPTMRLLGTHAELDDANAAALCCRRKMMAEIRSGVYPAQGVTTLSFCRDAPTYPERPDKWW